MYIFAVSMVMFGCCDYGELEIALNRSHVRVCTGATKHSSPSTGARITAIHRLCEP